MIMLRLFALQKRFTSTNYDSDLSILCTSILSVYVQVFAAVSAGINILLDFDQFAVKSFFSAQTIKRGNCVLTMFHNHNSEGTCCSHIPF